MAAQRRLNPEEKVERDACLLGYGGLAPFAAAALIAPLGLFLIPENVALALLSWGLAYAAVILSFMGGARWSLAMVSPDARPDRAMSGLLAAVAPALVAWAMLVPQSVLPFPLPLAARYAVLGLSFVPLLLDDLKGLRLSEGPVWYGSLRKRLTAGVGASIAIIVLALLFY